MIKIGEKSTENTINIIKDIGGYDGNYSIIMQNTLTKEITLFQELKDTGNKLFYEFVLSFKDVECGEYYLVLIENPDKLKLIIDRFQPNKIKTAEEEYLYITLNGDYITNASFFIVNGLVENQITPVCSELVSVGEYTSPKQQYNNEKKYYQYGN